MFTYVHAINDLFQFHFKLGTHLKIIILIVSLGLVS